MDLIIKTKQLTARERDVLKLICLPASEIAERLCVSETTIKSFKTNLRLKLNASNDVQILGNALKRGDITVEELITVEIERD